jgi:hypothetical protein
VVGPEYIFSEPTDVQKLHHPGSVKMWGLITEAMIVASINHNNTTTPQQFQNNAISTTPQYSAPCPRATRGIASLRVIFCAI